MENFKFQHYYRNEVTYEINNHLVAKNCLLNNFIILQQIPKIYYERPLIFHVKN